MNDLRSSLRIRYQPIVELKSRETRGFEVLVRVVDADGILHGPEALVDALVGGETTLALTKAIMEYAVAEYHDQDFRTLNMRFSFNIPLEGLLHPGLLGMIGQMRMPGDRDDHGISIELTEHQPVYDVAGVAAVITALRAAGHEVLLDDIVPETVNLDALLDTPLSAVKLDGSVVNSDAEVASRFIARIVAWGAKHGRGVVAEGIETEETLVRMQALRVPFGQGFLFAKPMPAEDLRGFLHRGEQNEAT